MKTNEISNKNKWSTPIITILNISETLGEQPGYGEDGDPDSGSQA